jgi:hypothetical protein
LDTPKKVSTLHHIANGRKQARSAFAARAEIISQIIELEARSGHAPIKIPCIIHRGWGLELNKFPLNLCIHLVQVLGHLGSFRLSKLCNLVEKIRKEKKL